MFCSKCGAQIADDSSFCSHCGEQVASAHSAGDSLIASRQASVNEIPKDQFKRVETEKGHRSEVYLPCSTDPKTALAKAEEILSENRFAPKDYNGEQVWKKGTGMMTEMQVVKLGVFDDYLGVQAWTLVGIGNAGLREKSLDGIVGAIPKKMLLNVVEKIRAAI